MLLKVSDDALCGLDEVEELVVQLTNCQWVGESHVIHIQLTYVTVEGGNKTVDVAQDVIYATIVHLQQ